MKAYLIAAACGVILVCGVAAAQVMRPPSGPNVSIAPANAADIAELNRRIQQIETAHNTTRTELAQARLELTATRNRLDTVVSALRAYAVCGAQPTTSGAGGAPPQTTQEAEQVLANPPPDWAVTSSGATACRARLAALH